MNGFLENHLKFTRKVIDMIAGIPGTGIGGIFYLLSALCMPLREMTKVVRGKSNLRRWKFIIMQLGLASGIIFGFWLTGLVLAMVIPQKAHMFLVRGAHGNILKIQPFIIAITVLFGVLLTVEILSLLIPKTRSR